MTGWNWPGAAKATRDSSRSSGSGPGVGVDRLDARTGEEQEAPLPLGLREGRLGRGLDVGELLRTGRHGGLRVGPPLGHRIGRLRHDRQRRQFRGRKELIYNDARHGASSRRQGENGCDHDRNV